MSILIGLKKLYYFIIIFFLIMFFEDVFNRDGNHPVAL